MPPLKGTVALVCISDGRQTSLVEYHTAALSPSCSQTARRMRRLAQPLKLIHLHTVFTVNDTTGIDV